MNRRIRFAASMALRRLTGADRTCPYCGSPDTQSIHRKMFLLDVLRCSVCDLMFRYPQATIADNAMDYQKTLRAVRSRKPCVMYQRIAFFSNNKA
jgi:transcription elongation factor Elf1